MILMRVCLGRGTTTKAPMQITWPMGRFNHDQVWHPGLTQEQSECFESKKKRAIKIIYKNLDYQEALTIAGLPTVKQRRIDMCIKLFTQMQNENHWLHKMLPAKKENSHCLRNINQNETIKCNTNGYKHSFVPFCLDHFQE